MLDGSKLHSYCHNCVKLHPEANVSVRGRPYNANSAYIPVLLIRLVLLWLRMSFGVYRNEWQAYKLFRAQTNGRFHTFYRSRRPLGWVGIALLFLGPRHSRWGWGVSPTSRPLLTPGKDPVPIVLEAGWAPGPVWTGGKSRPHRDSVTDRPARSQSLYRLSYPAHAN